MKLLYWKDLELCRKSSGGNLPSTLEEFSVVLFTCFLLEFWLFSSRVMVLAAQMCFYNQISQTVKFYVSLRTFKIRTGVIASFNPCRQSEYGDKVIGTICVFQNIRRECFLTFFVLCGLLSSFFFVVVLSTHIYLQVVISKQYFQIFCHYIEILHCIL